MLFWPKVLLPAPPPNKLPPALFCAPKAGLLAVPNMPPPVFALLALLPNPPNPVEGPAVAVLLPKRPPALVVFVVLPKPVRLPPNEDAVFPDPNPAPAVKVSVSLML